MGFEEEGADYIILDYYDDGDGDGGSGRGRDCCYCYQNFSYWYFCNYGLIFVVEDEGKVLSGLIQEDSLWCWYYCYCCY